jgi:hypothetical protein
MKEIKLYLKWILSETFRDHRYGRPSETPLKIPNSFMTIKSFEFEISFKISQDHSMYVVACSENFTVLMICITKTRIKQKFQ